MGEADECWPPFSAAQVYRATPPGFVWDARIRMLPGVGVHMRGSPVPTTRAPRTSGAAVRELLELRDPEAILRASGYAP